MSHGPPAYASAPEEGKTLYPQVPTDQPQQQPGGYYPPAQQPGSGQTAVTYYPPSGPQPQQQPQQLVVTQVPVVVSPQQPVKSYVAHIIFSCFVFWCCGWGCLCGLIAFILAILAHGRAGGQPQSAQSYGKASIILSIIGIVLGIIFIIITIVYFVVFASENCPYPADGKCFKARIDTYSASRCTRLHSDGYYSGGYCYYN